MTAFPNLHDHYIFFYVVSFLLITTKIAPGLQLTFSSRGEIGRTTWIFPRHTLLPFYLELEKYTKAVCIITNCTFDPCSLLLNLNHNFGFLPAKALPTQYLQPLAPTVQD